MPEFRCKGVTSLRWLSLVLWVSAIDAQTCMLLSPPTITARGTASLDLSLYSVRGSAMPASVQWTFQYPSASISLLTVGDGPALISSGKTAVCSGDAAAYKCLTVGMNTGSIHNGVIARLTAVLAPGSTTAPIQIESPLGASAAGYLIQVTSIVLTRRAANVASYCKPQAEKRVPGRK